MTTEEKALLALRIAVEQILRADGCTDEGVQHRQAEVVQKYLDMAAGEIPMYFGFTK